MAKAILHVTKSDIQEAAGVRQLCAGQIVGIEAAIHTVVREFLSEDVEAVLLVDASNAFNSLNREAALHNIQFSCPTLATALINIYREPTELFVDGLSLLSQEGTTQGDPFAMPFYALATIMLIQRLDGAEDLKQVWYADYASATGSLSSIHTWCNELSSVGPGYGYCPNASNTWLVTKSEHLDKAKQLFDKSNVSITCHGRPYLDAPLGSGDYVKEFVKEKVNMWVSELSLLSDIARAQPHASYAAFIHGFVHKFLYLCQTNSDIGSFLAPLEECISTIFIPALTGRPPLNALSRDLFALLARLGGPGITNLTKSSEALYLACVSITNPLASLISAQENIYPYECINAQLSAKSDVKKNHRRCEAEAACAIEDKTCKGPCLWPWKRGPQAGSLPARLRNLVSLYTRVPFGMPLHSDMAGCLWIAQLIVPVAPPFLYSMPCPVPKEGFLLYVTMR